MKRQSPLTGILFLLAAAFVAQAPQCGLIGHWVDRATVVLLGRYGAGLLVAALLVTGIALSGLGGVLWRAGAHVWRIWTTPVRVQARRAPTRTVRALPASQIAITVTPVEVTKPESKPEMKPPAKTAPESIKLQEIRGGLKYLEFEKAEIDSVMGKVDLSKSTEDVLRQAIGLLRKAA